LGGVKPAVYARLGNKGFGDGFDCVSDFLLILGWPPVIEPQHLMRLKNAK
jgi:hypothetical protein